MEHVLFINVHTSKYESARLPQAHHVIRMPYVDDFSVAMYHMRLIPSGFAKFHTAATNSTELPRSNFPIRCAKRQWDSKTTDASRVPDVCPCLYQSLPLTRVPFEEYPSR